MHRRRIQANGIALDVAHTGAAEASLIPLHSFPEFWYHWHAKLPTLATAGFRVTAPDLRDYNLSDKPIAVPRTASILSRTTAPG